MRGKEIRCTAIAVAGRITPAYAGKSQLYLSGKETHLGSPPPMRGKVFNEKGEAIVSRITPAYAGKSPQIHRKSFSVQDHPRLCGEKVQAAVLDNPQKGSPPPMRGKD